MAGMFLDYSELGISKGNCLMNIVKYVDRAGSKPFVSPFRDMFKVADFFHEAMTGKFLNEVVAPEKLEEWYEIMEREEEEMRNGKKEDNKETCR